MTLVERAARDRARPNARARHASVDLSTSVSVVASRAVRDRQVRAFAACRITAARRMALIRRRADYGCRTDACTRKAGIHLGARAAVATGRPVGGRGVRT